MHRRTTVLAATSLVASVLLVVYLVRRNELRDAQRANDPGGEFGESIVEEPAETGTFKRLDPENGHALVIEDANGREVTFVCYDNCSPLDENTESYVGKKIRVYWMSTSDEQDTPAEAVSTTEPNTPIQQERVAVRIEFLSQ